MHSFIKPSSSHMLGSLETDFRMQVEGTPRKGVDWGPQTGNSKNIVDRGGYIPIIFLLSSIYSEYDRNMATSVFMFPLQSVSLVFPLWGHHFGPCTRGKAPESRWGGSAGRGRFAREDHKLIHMCVYMCVYIYVSKYTHSCAYLYAYKHITTTNDVCK